MSQDGKSRGGTVAVVECAASGLLRVVPAVIGWVDFTLNSLYSYQAVLYVTGQVPSVHKQPFVYFLEAQMNSVVCPFPLSQSIQFG